VTFCHGLKLEADDGKKYATDCANTEGIFRIIQSVPSPKAEPFKLWLAKIGKERIDEIENPELGMNRIKSLYEKKGEEMIRKLVIEQGYNCTIDRDGIHLQRESH